MSNSKRRVSTRLPPRPTHFFGRERELAKAVAALRPCQPLILAGPPASGKTAMALELVHLEFENFESVHWVNARVSNPKKTAKVYSACTHSTLLVIDGACDLSWITALTELNTTTLVTTTQREWPDATVQVLPPIAFKEALKFFSTPVDSHSMRRIFQVCAGLPGLLQEAAAQVCHASSLAEYASQLHTHPEILTQATSRILHELDSFKETEAFSSLKALAMIQTNPVPRRVIQAGLNNRQLLTEEGLQLLTAKGVLENGKSLCSYTAWAVRHVGGFPLSLARMWASAISEELTRCGSIEEMREFTRPVKVLLAQYLGIKEVNAVALELYALAAPEELSMVEYTASVHANWADTRPELLGRVAYSKKQYMEAAKCFRSAWPLTSPISLDAYANTCYYLGQYEDALSLFHQALTLQENHSSTAQSHKKLGKIYKRLQEETKASHHFAKSLQLYEDAGETSQTAKLRYTLGLLCTTRNGFEEALQFYTVARQEFVQLGCCVKLADTSYNLAAAHESLGHLDQAVKEFNSAMFQYSIAGLDALVSDCLRRIAHLQFLQGKRVNALASYMKAKTTLEAAGEQVKLAELLVELGTCHRNVKQYQQSIEVYEQAIHIYCELSGPGSQEVAEARSQIEQTLEEEQRAVAAPSPLTETRQNSLGAIELEESQEDSEDDHQSLEPLSAGLSSARLLLQPLIRLSQDPDTVEEPQLATNLFPEVNEKEQEIEEQTEEQKEVKEEKEDETTKDNDKQVQENVASKKVLATIESQFRDALAEAEVKELAFAHYKNALAGKDLEVTPLGAILVYSTGLAYEELGRTDEAKAAYTQALDLFRSLYGGQHSGTGDCLYNLGSIHTEEGSYSEALSCYSQALDTYTQVCGQRDRKVADTYYNIASVYMELHEPTSAIEFFESALAVYTEGNNSSKMADTLNTLGYLCQTQNNRGKALQYFLEAAELYKLQEDPDAAMCFNNLGCLYQELGQLEDSAECYGEAVVIRTKHFGRTHPKTEEVLCRLAGVYEKQGKLELSLSCLNDRVRDQRRSFRHKISELIGRV